MTNPSHSLSTAKDLTTATHYQPAHGTYLGNLLLLDQRGFLRRNLPVCSLLGAEG